MTKEEAKHLSEVLKAYSEGKTIQIHYSEGWMPLSTTNILSVPIEKLRIKPELKYRHYISTEEFLKAQKEHGPYLDVHSQTNHEFAIAQTIDNCSILVSGARPTYRQLLERYTWQDGTPCGVLE